MVTAINQLYSVFILTHILRQHHLRVGCSVKAHLTKADLTEIVISLPFRLFLSDK